MLTAVLQDLGDSSKSKQQCVLVIGSKKSKNWEGFPQTSQSHKTLKIKFSQKTENKTNKIRIYHIKDVSL